MKSVAIVRGFSNGIINSIYNELITRTHSSFNSVLNRNLITLPYFPKISHQISQILMKWDFKVIYCGVADRNLQGIVTLYERDAAVCVASVCVRN